MRLPIKTNLDFSFWSKTKIKSIFQIILGLLSILVGIYFIRHERLEIGQVKTILQDAKIGFLVGGILLVFVFVLVQGWMYQYSFRAIHRRIPLKMAVFLFLKRNFISVFIPAGLVTNIFFFNKDIREKAGIAQSYIYTASTIFSICSIGSTFLIAIPAILILFYHDGFRGDIIIGIFSTLGILTILVLTSISLMREGLVYRILERRAPQLATQITALTKLAVRRSDVLKVLGFSFVIEIIGVIHLYISMAALDIAPSWPVAIIGYTLVLVILMTSPFLRGIGAIEAALTYALTLYGYSAVSALSAVILFRFFEFWCLLGLGSLALVLKKDGIILQLLAPLLIFFLGIVNILSGLTPALVVRAKLLRNFIPYDVTEVSNTAVIVIGVVLIVTSIALVRRYRNSYYIALFLTAFSLIGHIFKGIDYEESILALVTMSVLIFQRKEYFIKSPSIKLPKWEIGLAIFITVIIYGISGFYLLDFRHFNEDFTIWSSVIATFKCIALIDIGWVAETPFARYFLLSLNILGIGSLMYLLWLTFRSIKSTHHVDEGQIERAKRLVVEYGNSSMDYFKTYPDKQFYFFENNDGFISYKNTKRYSIVLGNPVCIDNSNEILRYHLKKFETNTMENNRKVVYHRIPMATKNLYESLGKKSILIGEEGIVHLESFTLVGKDVSALRHAVNKMKKDGYVFKVNPPPQSDGFMQQLAYVSNEWLKHMERDELCFSQGVFSFKELKQQTILTVENEERKIVAFLNVIPSVKDELNFDLMRKTSDAPSGTMDFLFVSMMLHYKDQNYKTVNMGMVPLSGYDEPDSLPEHALKLAYERTKFFDQYKNLRWFKEKFNPSWSKVYAAYDNDLDLINLTSVLNTVQKNCPDIK